MYVHMHIRVASMLVIGTVLMNEIATDWYMYNL